MSRSLFSLVGLSALCLFSLPALADYRFDIWTADSGLPQNSIGRIVQTRDGYLWLTTLDGLVRFDGVRFTIFDKSNSPGLPSNRITSLYEDQAGDLWVGTEDLGLARYRQGRFTSFGPAHGLPAGLVDGISGDEEGNLWVLAGNVLVLWKDGRFAPALSDREAALFDSKAVRHSMRGLLWATNQTDLRLYVRGEMTALTRSNGLPSLRVTNVDEDGHGALWVATEDAGLAKVRDGKVIRVYTQQDGLPTDRLHRPGQSAFTATWVCEDRKGNLWLAGAGPWLGRLKDGAFTAYPNSTTLSSPPFAAGLSPWDRPITVLFEDREGNLWIGTDGGGLIRAREQVVNVFSTSHGLHAANIYPVCEDSSGGVWLGAWSKGLVRIKDGVVTNFGEPTRDWIVTGLWPDRDQQLWVASLGAGLSRFQNGLLTSRDVPSDLMGQAVHAIYQDRSGTLWFHGDRGLYRFRNGEISLIPEPEGRRLAPAKVIIEDQSGSLWIGTYEGLTRLENGRFTHWTERDGLPSNSVRALYEDRDRTLWIGTYDGGLGRFKAGKFTRYTIKEGLFNNGVFQILEDGRGNFWMSSNRGIHRASKQHLNEFAEGRRRTITSISYGKSDGMLNVECNGGCSPAGVRTRDGKLWFPTQDGVAVIDPESIPTNPLPPPVVIESFLLERKPLAVDGSLRVPPRQANIEIQYTSLSFINSERLQFKYRLEGVDKDWVEAGTRRTAYYSHVAPGEYTFRVLAANSDGVWNETGASLAFAVLPAWHQTAWFRALAVVSVGIASLGFYRHRISRLEALRRTQQEFSRRLIESQDAERKRIAAELHDSLGQELLVIKNRALLGLNGPERALHASEHLAEISRLTSAALQEVRDIAYNLRPYQLDQFGLTEGIEAIVHRFGKSSGIHFTVEVEPIDGLFAAIDESHLFRVIQEATNNIVKHSGTARASVRVRREDGCVRVVVEDEGRGFSVAPTGSHSNPASTMSPEQERGFGLPGMAERVRILRGTIQVKSAPGEGTRLELTVPIPTHDPTNSSASGR